MWKRSGSPFNNRLVKLLRTSGFLYIIASVGNKSITERTSGDTQVLELGSFNCLIFIKKIVVLSKSQKKFFGQNVYIIIIIFIPSYMAPPPNFWAPPLGKSWLRAWLHIVN